MWLADMAFSFPFPLHWLVNKLLAAEAFIMVCFLWQHRLDLTRIGLIRFRLDWILLEEPGIYYVGPKDTENRQRLQATRPQKCLCLCARHTKCHKLMPCGCGVCCLLFLLLIVCCKNCQHYFILSCIEV